MKWAAVSRFHPRLYTNAHVVNALIEIAQSYTAELKFVAVRDGGKLGTEFYMNLINTQPIHFMIQQQITPMTSVYYYKERQ